MNGVIHLGHELGTGNPVDIPVRHMVVTGQSQEAGKTTTLEALTSRANLPAIAFVTKRFEKSFQGDHQLFPYFRQRADWQFVAAILEATLHERMKFQRSWIMKLCQSTAHWNAPKTLRDVQQNVARALQTAKGLNESVYTELKAYLDLVVPEIETLPTGGEPALTPGLNVMDLSRFSSQMQSLVIQSTLDWVYHKRANTLTIIPEAWEFIPQKRGSPVKLAAEQLIRKGAAGKNYVWLDSQDLANVDKDILRQATVWILGVQREYNETKRTLSHIYAKVKPSANDIMGLGLGQFVVCYGTTMKKVYVTPRGANMEAAADCARGILTPEQMRDSIYRPPALRINPEKDEAMWKEKFESSQREIEELNRQIAELKETIKSWRSVKQPLPESGPKPLLSKYAVPESAEAMYAYIKDRASQDPELLRLLVTQPQIEFTVQRPVIELDTSTLRGRIAGLITEGYFDEPRNGNTVYNELRERRKFPTAKPNVYRECDKLCEMGFLTFEGTGYQKTGLSVERRKAS